METITSGDGTGIAYERWGSGPPVVFVHGTGADHGSWDGLRSDLEGRVTGYAVERRGRGESGDAAAYDPEREFADVAAVVDAVDEPAVLFGHSFGALCALEAALRVDSDDLRGLVLYEPPVGAVEHGYYVEETGDELARLFVNGEDEAVVVHYLREVVELPAGAVEELRASPGWPRRVAAAHTVVREYRATAEYAFDATRFEAWTTPTLLVTGAESFAWAAAATETLAAALPDARVASLAGAGHVGYATDPEQFSRTLLRFVTGTG